MRMSGSVDNPARLVLLANRDSPDPVIVQDFLQRRSFAGIEFQHADDYISGLARQQSHETPRAFDDFLALACLARLARLGLMGRPLLLLGWLHFYRRVGLGTVLVIASLRWRSIGGIVSSLGVARSMAGVMRTGLRGCAFSGIAHRFIRSKLSVLCHRRKVDG
jgi:hypothetical protein